MEESDEQVSEGEEELLAVEWEMVTAKGMDDWSPEGGWSHGHVLGLKAFLDFQLHLRTLNGHHPADVSWGVLEEKGLGVSEGQAWVDGTSLGEVGDHQMVE